MKTDFSRVMDALPGLVWTMNADDGIDYVNNRWLEYTGQTLERLRQEGLESVIHPADIANFQSAVRSARETIRESEIDVRIQRTDEEYRWFTLRLAPLDPSDEKQGWCGIASFADSERSGKDARNAPDHRLLRFLNDLPIQIVFFDKAGEVEFINEHALSYFGKRFDELRNWVAADVIHPEDVPQVRQRLANISSHVSNDDANGRMRRGDGAFRWFRSTLIPSRDANGNIVRYVSIRTDIDELKKAERLLTVEIELLRMVARADPLPLVLDTLCALVEELSPGSYCSILGVDSDAGCFRLGAGPSLPQSYNELFDGKAIDPGYGPCSLAATLKQPIVTATPSADPRWEGSSWPSLIESIGFQSCWSTPIFASDGTTIGVFALYKREAEGATSLEQNLVDRFINIASLVIERTQADAALRQASEDLQRTNRFLVETQRLTLTASFTWDVERNEHIWSEENYRIFEFDPASEITLEKILAAVHPDDLPEVETLLAEAAGGDDFELAFRLVPASGKMKYAHVVGRRIDQVTDRPVFMGAIQDITARKLTEEALDHARSELTRLARVSTLGALTASIAHEVSQPLSGIITNSSACLRLLAADPPDIDKARATAERTIRDGNRASEVIKRLRAMFAADPHRFEPVDLHDAVREVLALCNTEIRSGGAILRHDFMPGTPLVVGDRVQIQQVVLNLILNALDAMSEVNDRSRSLLLSTTETEHNGVRLAVRDSGIGLDAQSADKLFDAFYTTKPHGMGVGLAISRSIIENHGGRLTAARNDGHGATFAFAMPIHERGLEREMNVVTIN
jgi:PAS domain S-box-containing protein